MNTGVMEGDVTADPDDTWCFELTLHKHSIVLII